MSPRFGSLPSSPDESGLAAYFAALLDAGLTWTDVDWLGSITKLPVLVKGIVRPDDAIRAVDHGAAAIVVSNHGGRQLDTSPATIDVLEGIVEGGVVRSLRSVVDFYNAVSTVRPGRSVTLRRAPGRQAPAEWKTEQSAPLSPDRPRSTRSLSLSDPGAGRGFRQKRPDVFIERVVLPELEHGRVIT